jgi:hypothetical protein
LAAFEVVHVAGRDDLRPAMRGFLVALALGQVLLAGLTLRRSTAAATVLLLCTATATVALLAGGNVVAAAGAAAVLALLGRSLRWFPTYAP